MSIHRLFMPVAVACLMMGACQRTPSRTADQAPPPPAEPKNDALVRVIQAHPDAPQADVYAGNQKTFAGVGYGTVTPYKSVADDLKITLRPAGQETGVVMIESQSAVQSGKRYTALAEADRDYSAKLALVPDEVRSPSPGKALVRVIHADPQSGPVDLLRGASAKDAIISDVDYGAPPRYTEVEPVGATVRVAAKTEATRSRAARSPALLEKTDIEAGKVYTLVVAPSDEPGKPVKMIKVEDPVTSDEPPPASEPKPERP